MLRSGPGGVVRLRTWRTVRQDTAPQYTASPPTAATRCCSTSTSSPAATPCRSPSDVTATLDAAEQRTLPADVTIANWYDQSDLIVASASSVRDAVLIGVVLAALVLLLFLRNWKITLIAVLVVPVVLAATVLLLYAAAP